jgi:hypothetical protein
MMAPWKIAEITVAPNDFWTFFFDSIRLLNTRTSPIVKSRVTALRGG